MKLFARPWLSFCSCWAFIFFVKPGKYLIVNNLQKSDVIVVLAGDTADERY